MDRQSLDAGAGRVALRDSLLREPPSGGAPSAKRTASAQPSGKRSVRPLPMDSDGKPVAERVGGFAMSPDNLGANFKLLLAPCYASFENEY